MKVKETIKIVNRKDVFFLLDNNNKIKKFKPWLGDMFSFLYDRIMEKSIFPKKFSASISKHYEILNSELNHIRNANILELACGSGDAVKFLNSDIFFTGVDISKGLLKIANKNFHQNKFSNTELFVADVCDLPFQNDYFDYGICNLSLNFFKNIDKFIFELRRVLKNNASFFCSIPLPEKKNPRVKIHGLLYTKEKLKEKFQNQNFVFEELPYENGILLYFKARLEKL
ncbi:MAG: class I SAM-dependent methyltransferase [Ignavibacteriales bacterium]|nr:class I SAM-dependent methyltransferase [Ignavibacteriales bacterium]